MNYNFEPFIVFTDIIFFKMWNKSYKRSRPNRLVTAYGLFFWIFFTIKIS